MEIMTVDYAKQKVKELESICSVRLNLAAFADLASCYFTLGEPEKALPLAQRAWEWNRKEYGVATNLAMIYKDLGMHPESAHTIEHAYWCNSEDFYARLGYAEALLKAGLWRQAWPIYDNARPTQQAAAEYLQLPRSVKEWNGEPLSSDAQLLVINEGGAGDRLSYARWLPELTKLGINWTFFPFEELFSFFERVFPKERLIKDGDEIKPTHWTTTFALPAKLNVGPNEIPKPLPLTALPEKIAKYKFGRTDGLPAIGVCYEAAELFQGGRKVRSLSEGQAMRLICSTADKVHYVNLQLGKKMPAPVINVQFETWEDTAGLLANLDGVVTVDTGVMHLAGAMGKPMATLLSSNSCWKFLTKKTKCPWYPTSKLYRNDGFGSGMDQSINSLITDIRSGAWPQLGTAN